MHILITGAASGIGKATATYFLNQGHTVYGIDIAPAPDREQFKIFTASITDEEALLDICQTLSRQGVLLDRIINVAGIHMMASLVESDYEKMKKLVDINLSGTILVNRVFHRLLTPHGRILIVTSEVATLDPVPFNGLYSVTKSALETYAQALRQELNLIGQQVITIRPGAVHTPLCDGSVKATAELADITVLYKNQAKSFSGLAAKFMGRPISPEALAALVYKAATAKYPRLAYQKNASAGLVLLNILPKRWQCGIIKVLLKLNLF